MHSNTPVRAGLCSADMTVEIWNCAPPKQNDVGGSMANPCVLLVHDPWRVNPGHLLFAGESASAHPALDLSPDRSHRLT